MLQPILILILFAIVTVLMFNRKLPTLVALPLLAVGIAIIAGVPLNQVDKDGVDTGILVGVIESGTTKLVSAYVAVIFGAWLGQIMNQTGISKNIVKMAAELGGDRPLIITILLTSAVGILFTTIGGLGAIIMVGNIVLPILISVGVPALTAVCLFLLGQATGLAMNIANWTFYMDVIGVSQATIRSFALTVTGLTALVTLVFMLVEFKRNGKRYTWAQTNTPSDLEVEKVPIISLFTPLIPLLLVLVLDWPIIPAFIVGILYSLITTQRSFTSFVSTMTKSAFEGVADAAPAVILMMGIGMLLNAVMHPQVSDIMAPLLKAVVPSSVTGYILFFALLAPLALYRGPLNMWGLGSGIAGLIISLNILSPSAVMGALLSTERMQVIADPTNTHNVWLANYAGVDVNQILWKLLPYTWVLTLMCIVAAAIGWF